VSLEVVLSLFEDIKEAIELISERAEGIDSPADFLRDNNGLTKLDAISMRLQVIGESLKKVGKLNPHFLNKYPEIEWGKIKGMRDFISHQYNKIDEVQIFTACKFDIPELEKTVNRIIEDLNKSGVV
jgi:uncharacterized protein with HEPN domain